MKYIRLAATSTFSFSFFLIIFSQYHKLVILGLIIQLSFLVVFDLIILDPWIDEFHGSASCLCIFSFFLPYLVQVAVTVVTTLPPSSSRLCSLTNPLSYDARSRITGCVSYIPRRWKEDGKAVLTNIYFEVFVDDYIALRSTGVGHIFSAHGSTSRITDSWPRKTFSSTTDPKGC